MFFIKSDLLLTLLTILLSYMGCDDYQTKYIFYPQKLKNDFKFDSNSQEVFIKTDDGEILNGLFFSYNCNKVILFFHGNQGSLDSWQHVYKYYESLGINFFIIDYRGYGKSTGEITEDGLYNDGQTAYKYLLSKGFSEQNIIVLGRSIGTGIAVDLASKKVLHALILESPFSDFEVLFKSKVSLPIKSQYKFNNIEKIKSVTCPVLLIHGEKDDLIPSTHSKKIYDAILGKKEILIIPNAHHNDLGQYPEYTQAIMLFLSYL